MLIVAALVGLVLLTVLLHLTTPWWLTPLASNWGAIDSTIEITVWVTGFVFIAVNLFLAWVIWRYRHSKNLRAHYEPENTKLEGWLLVLTTVGVAAMLTPGLIVWASFVDVPEDATQVEAIGQQWEWAYRFPGEDGKLGSADARFVTVKNPYGINPDDADGQDDIVIDSNRLHLPVDEPVQLLMRSNDVLHDFAVPEFRVKMDLVPGTQTQFWFTPSRKGQFEVLCEELCGMAHYTMKGQVVVEDRGDFEVWLARQPTFSQTQAETEADLAAGEQLFSNCAGCHGAEGQGNANLQAPNLTLLEPWYMERQLRYYREGIRGTHKEDAAGRQMASFAASLPDPDELRNVLAYINSLPVQTSPQTIEGNAKRGAVIFQTCAACHGKQARGKTLMSAPRLAGQADWYLRRQLEHFSMGWRGKHPEDQYGTQMRLMTRTIHNPERLKDLLAYIATL